MVSTFFLWICVLVLFISTAGGFSVEPLGGPPGGGDGQRDVTVASVGDVNGDGHPDIVVAYSSTRDNTPGSCTILNMYNGIAVSEFSQTIKVAGQVPEWTLDAQDISRNRQYCSDAFHVLDTQQGIDVNGDGISDVVIGAPHCRNEDGVPVGCLYVFYGSEQGLKKGPDVTVYGDTDGGRFGGGITSHGTDLCVSIPGRAKEQVVCYSVSGGQADRLRDNPSWKLVPDGDKKGSGFGSSVSLGTIRTPDATLALAVGIPGYNDFQGAVQVFMRSTGQSITVKSPLSTRSHFGYQVSLADSTLAVSAPYGPDGSGPGVIYIYNLNDVTTGSIHTIMAPKEIREHPDAPLFGALVHHSGDLNRDGHADLVISSFPLAAMATTLTALSAGGVRVASASQGGGVKLPVMVLYGPLASATPAASRSKLLYGPNGANGFGSSVAHVWPGDSSKSVLLVSDPSLHAVYQCSTVLPGPPTDFKIANVGGNGIDLTWDASVSDGGSPDLKYRILRREYDMDGNLLPMPTKAFAGLPCCTYLDTSVVPGKIFGYRISARTSVGATALSAEVLNEGSPVPSAGSATITVSSHDEASIKAGGVTLTLSVSGTEFKTGLDADLALMKHFLSTGITSETVGGWGEQAPLVIEEVTDLKIERLSSTQLAVVLPALPGYKIVSLDVWTVQLPREFTVANMPLSAGTVAIYPDPRPLHEYPKNVTAWNATWSTVEVKFLPIQSGLPGTEVPPPTSYRILSVDVAGIQLQEKEVIAEVGTALSTDGIYIHAIVTGLIGNTTYDIVIIPVNAAGQVPLPNITHASFHTLDAVVPSPPLNFELVPSTESPSAEAVLVSWRPPVDHGGAVMNMYLIYAASSANPATYELVKQISPTDAQVAGQTDQFEAWAGPLEPGTTYTFHIRAQNQVGMSNPSLATASVLTLEFLRVSFPSILYQNAMDYPTTFNISDAGISILATVVASGDIALVGGPGSSDWTLAHGMAVTIKATSASGQGKLTLTPSPTSPDASRFRPIYEWSFTTQAAKSVVDLFQPDPRPMFFPGPGPLVYTFTANSATLGSGHQASWTLVCEDPSSNGVLLTSTLTLPSQPNMTINAATTSGTWAVRLNVASGNNMYEYLSTELVSFTNDLDECDVPVTADCHVTLATCTNVVGSWDCKCIPGTSGDGVTCVDIDECTEGTHACVPEATCVNTLTSYHCVCPVGYQGDGLTPCTDIDECAMDVHNCDPFATCTNTDGSFTCACDTPWVVGDGVNCTDVDECTLGTHNCMVSSLAFCNNTHGSFECLCIPGYVGDAITSCVEADECLSGSHNCHPVATCADTFGSFTCTCPANYVGDGVTCDPIVNCVVSPWGGYGGCVGGDCENGSKKRTRSVVTAPLNGGTGCPSLSQTVGCSKGCNLFRGCRC